MGYNTGSFINHIKYAASEFINRHADFFGTGVINPSSDFYLAYPSTPNMTINVAGSGTAWVIGSRYGFDGVTPMSLTFAGNSSGNPRIDLIELGPLSVNIALGVNQNFAQIIIKQGTPAVSPIQPTADSGFVGLYAVLVPSGATYLNAGSVTDLRKRVTVFGIDLVKIFDGTLGHKHTGVAGDGPQISNSGLATGTAVANIGYTPVNKAGDNLTGALNESQGISIASAATTSIGAATGNFVQITGTTTITSLGTVQAGTKRVVEFLGILTLTYNATALILPGDANIITASGDSAEFISLGSGNWICTRYTVAAMPPTRGQQTFATNGTFVVPSGVTKIYASACAGGGGGAGTYNNTSTSTVVSGGGGGGAGQSILKQPYTVTPGQSIPITVGVAGTAGAVGGGGGSGGSTSIGSIVTLAGGVGGTSYTASVSPAGGGYGGSGYPNGSDAQDAGAAGTGSGGAGASSPFGGGGGAGRSTTGGATRPGRDSYGYGSGGGGAGGTSIGAIGTGSIGGAGSPGIVIVEW